MALKIKDRIRAIDVECGLKRAEQRGLERALSVVLGEA